jgi:diacylglycerol kinase (ATP)
MDRLWRATVNSWNGLKAAIRTEAAFRQEIAVLLVAIPLAFVIGQTAWTRLLLVGVVVFLMIVELLNTAVEKLADRVSREIDHQIGTAKDIGSAAVGLSLLLVGAVWLLALAQRLGWL